ncbi:hypothetical protein FIV34_04080 [Luteibacter pinisoli]|uniref:Uncharacterized protein n=1 Tax=Luteibacter pinisoli TaxID=2589080 RepID=A0A4Y5Z193_9GAMM|nr:hypothetical protein [Luteibacter pinisoli]QDE38435.1 hypothetical protein FIV34_04080 [Luteibacter pinisoli]
MAFMGPWVCDTCGNSINSAGEGWVEWLSRFARKGEGETVREAKDLRLVHAFPASPLKGKHRCQHDEDEAFKFGRFTVSDLCLDRFVGPEGLSYLLMTLSDAPESMRDAWSEMIQRIHVPNFDRALPHITAAIDEGVIDPTWKQGYYHEDQLAAVVQYADEKAAARRR